MKDGSLRCCVDYRGFNNTTTKDSCPLPTISDCLDVFGFATCSILPNVWSPERLLPNSHGGSWQRQDVFHSEKDIMWKINFAFVAAPLHALTGKYVKFQWAPDFRRAYRELKDRLVPTLGTFWQCLQMKENIGYIPMVTYRCFKLCDRAVLSQAPASTCVYSFKSSITRIFLFFSDPTAESCCAASGMILRLRHNIVIYMTISVSFEKTRSTLAVVTTSDNGILQSKSKAKKYAGTWI